MQNYSPQELERMQKQAIDRVHEMQRQAKMGKAENRRNVPPQSPPTAQAQQRHQTESPPQPQKQEKTEPPFFAAPPKQKKQPPSPPVITRAPGTRPAASFLSMDSDTALILPLILLLQKDGADEMLILALLYIMA